MMRWCLQRLFSTFPGGRAGLGLLVLRLVVGLVAVLYPEDIDFVSAVPATLILFGFLTPLAGAWLAGALAISQVRLGVSVFNGLSAVLMIAGNAALALLGAGAFSVDAWLFGRREIVVPRSRS